MTDLRSVTEHIFQRIITRGDLSQVEAFIAPDYVDHRGGPPGPQGFAAGLRMVREAFPDWQSSLSDTVVEGNKVAARWTVTGTHEAPFMGIAPTGARVRMEECGILRFDDQGRLAEIWRVADELGLMRQLGVVESI
jgi:predicted ester cyclase